MHAVPRDSHVDRLRKRKDGPYYVAPDSVEPLPNGMWADLNTDTVEKESRQFPSAAWPSDTGDPEGLTRNAVPEEHRKFLEGGGPAARDLLRELERGL